MVVTKKPVGPKQEETIRATECVKTARRGLRLSKV
jgi:hypothetical protein